MVVNRSILHVDMDAFFASVEQFDHPAMRGKPVLVGSARRRGVVAAASYEARVFGCRSAQPMAVALRLCPHAIIAPVRMSRYREKSEEVFAIFERFTPLVEPLSIDEAFLDVTGSERLHGSAESIARAIKSAVRAETKLTASVGIAPNKFLAKLASDMRKPDGLMIISPGQIDEVLIPLPIEKIWGIGPKTAEAFHNIGIRTIGQLRTYPLEDLISRFGSSAEHYHALAFGRDARSVETDGEAKSIGQEQTFETNVDDRDALHDLLLEQCEQVGRRLRKHALFARRVTVKIRYGDFETITRSHTLPEATDSTLLLHAAAKELFDTWSAKSFRPVRLLGCTAGELSKSERQLSLFADPAGERERKLDSALDSINAKFGKSMIHRGRNA